MTVLVRFQRISVDPNEPGVSPGSLPCQYEWGAYIPLLHRVLADPHGGHRFPSLPAREDPISHHTAYWEACHYLLVVLLGWQNLSRGLEWYLDEGRSADDFFMTVLRELFDGQGQLAGLAAWVWSGGVSWNQSELRVQRKCVRTPPTGDGWWDGERITRDNEAFAPAYGGTNPLHLGHSIDVDYRSPQTGLMAVTGSTIRSATVLLDEMSGWYYELATITDSLPDIGPRSWHVEVVVKPVGWLGTFRKSRDTGLWFLGKHSVHMAGQ